MLEDQISLAEMDGMLEPLAHVVQKVGAEVEYIYIRLLELFEFQLLYHQFLLCFRCKGSFILFELF